MIVSVSKYKEKSDDPSDHYGCLGGQPNERL